MDGWVLVLFWWLAFGGSHIVLSSMAVRQPLIARIGERGFQGLYSLVAFATFIPLVRTYWQHKHDGPLLWSLGPIAAVRGLAIVLAGVAVVFAVLSFAQPSPTSMVPGAPGRARGLTRITRHPLFMAVGLWGLMHGLVNGFLSDVIFFGGFVAYALIGSAHQDARKRGSEALLEFYAETSLLPFGAILGGRNRLVLSEIPWVGALIGLAVAAALYHFHPRLFGGFV